MQPIIRHMNPAELNRVAFILWSTTWQSYRGLVEDEYLAPATLEQYQKYMENFTDRALVAEVDGLVVGFCCYDALYTGITGWGQICAIGVLEEYRRAGIGTELLEGALDLMPQCNTVIVTVWEQMHTVLGLLTHYGFQPYGVTLTDPQDPHNTRKQLLWQRQIPTVGFDLFLHQLETNPMGEVCFGIDGDPVYSCCWLGGPYGSIPKYWLGLAEGEAYYYSTARELVDAPVFRGKSLRQIWDLVRIEDLDGVEPLTWAAARKKSP